jgi:cytochrome c-type biogenesis protein CcmH
MRVWARAASCAALLVAASAAAADLEAEAKLIEEKLMAPCCMTNTVAVHESGVSYQMRRQIREMLAAGRGEAEILDFYVDEYGPQILAMPEARGFSLTAYLFPFVFLVLAGVGLAIALRRWRSSAREIEPAAEPPAPSGPYAERLKRELDRFD